MKTSPKSEMHLATSGKVPNIYWERLIQKIRKYLNLGDFEIILGSEFHSIFPLSSLIIATELSFERSGGSKDCQEGARVGLMHEEGVTQEIRIIPAQAVLCCNGALSHGI